MLTRRGSSHWQGITEILRYVAERCQLPLPDSQQQQTYWEESHVPFHHNTGYMRGLCYRRSFDSSWHIFLKLNGGGISRNSPALQYVIFDMNSNFIYRPKDHFKNVTFKAAPGFVWLIDWTLFKGRMRVQGHLVLRHQEVTKYMGHNMTLMVTPLPGVNWISIQASKFCQLLVE